MGQKVNPISFRLGVNRSWNSRWHSHTNYTQLIHEDLQIQKYLEAVYEKTGVLVGGCTIQRNPQRISIFLTLSEQVKKRNQSVDISAVQSTLEKMTRGSVSLLINEVPTTSNAMLLAKDIARQLEERSPFAVVLKKAMQSVMDSKTRKVLGIKIQCSGRLNGEDIARTEWVKEGQVPLHTLDASIDYAAARAYTIYGVCGIKVWICFDSERK
jgi:small subunit ribosomal protein S3